ncbi:hypothetical protein M2139_001747, partial [Enterococcus sp. PF1-24]|nr:hypothetical protein [Enterococcus sp. PFB1-1]MDH6401847.1 hypothetical protein [Enterococcus sp. PF1-24]
MRIIDFFMNHNKKIQENPPEITTEWQELPAFIETDPAEYELVSVLATAIAAGDHPESEFVV